MTDCENSRFFCAWYKNETGRISSTCLPQIYHKLNLLMLWFNKYILSMNFKTNNSDELL